MNLGVSSRECLLEWIVAAHVSFKEDSNEGQDEILGLGRRVEKEGKGHENLQCLSLYLKDPFMMRGGPSPSWTRL